ncbi:MAG: hypothetical protein LUQ25_04905 [Methanoregulaceae archaeon]|nr:hypothetical protein [Methanoregulaceae archaeon]
MNDRAIAPVIGVMLILAVGVTFFSVYMTTYLPALKQQAEIGHLREVETGIMRFSSDVDNAILAGKQSGRGGTLSEQVRLGGGAFLLNPLESSGTIRIIENDTFALIVTTGGSVEHRFDSTLVNLSYQPSNNFWIDQGYTWQNGYVVTTKGVRSAPLQYVSQDELRERAAEFVNDLVAVYSDNGSDISIDTVSLSAGPANVTSGNGMARISLDSDVTREYFTGCTNLSYERFDTSAPFNGTIPKTVTVVNYTIPVNITVKKVNIVLETV